MRKLIISCFNIATAIALATLPSCTQQEPDIPTPEITFSDKVEVDFESISLSCTISGNVTADKLIVEYSKDQTLANAQQKTFEKHGEQFNVTISGLEIQTTYYYRYTVENKASSYKDEKIRQFKTLDYVVPVVTTGDVKNVSGTKATLEGSIDFTCGKEILEKGFFFGKDNKNLEAKPTTESSLTLSVDGLEFETTYYYQAYAKSEIGTGKGEIKEFKTNNAVSFNVVTVQDITATSVLAKGGIADNGGIEIEKQGFRYSEGTSEEYVFAESTGEKTITSLKPATSYKIWYYAKTFEGEFESEKAEFETKDGIVLLTTSSPENVTTTAALLKGLISSDGGSSITERGFCYSQSEMPTVSSAKAKVAGTIGEFQYSLTNLPQNKTYYVRAYAINAIGTYYGDQVSFTTLYDSVIFGTTSCSNVTASSASLKGSITSNGGSTVTKCGFCYSTSANPTVNDQLEEVTDSKTNLVATIKNLKSGVTYHVRAFATNANSTFYSNETTFITEDGIIQFASPELNNIAAESVVASTSIISAGGGTITERGFCYGLTKNPTTSSNTVKTAGTTGDYNCTITGLKNNTVYYIRAYAINESGTYYSSEATVTTLSGIASVSTSAATNVKALTATINGEIVSDGGSNITERGFCYGTTANPTTSSTVVKISGTVGSITKDLTNLTKATKYYVRAYAINGYGTHYGNEIYFTTSDGKALFETLSSSDVTVSSFKVSTNITTDGDNTITQRGFCYAATTGPTTSDNKIIVSGTTGSLSGTITGLTNKTKYYVRAFATNATGTSYSSEISVTTLSGLPDVETTAITNVLALTADVSGNVVSANGGTITSRGFCYGTTENPTTSNTKVTVTGTTGSMSKTLSSLTPGTTYHVRAYATTSFGTTYGDDKSFTTQTGTITFANLASSNVLAASATLSVEITGDGGSTITERGFCYATTELPTTSDTKVSFGGDNTTYSKSISNLARSTVYYFRAYAKNAVGTSYSNQVIVTTQSGIPALSTITANEVAQTTISLTGNVTSDGGADITQRGFCYSTSQNPTTSTTVKTIEGTTGVLSGTLTGLLSDQKYYIKAFAKTQYGTAYSEELSVSTIAGIATLGKTTVHDINPTSVTLASTIVSNGGTDILSLGFCYGTSSGPTVSNNTVAASPYLTNFSAQATSLEQDTKYYVRAFATTQYGTSYGEETSFTTTYNPVVFGNVTSSDVLLRSMSLNGSITSDGGNEITERGFCLSTVPAPTTSNIVCKVEGTTGTMNTPVKGLQHSSKYYIRPYAINRIKTFYGEQVEIETITPPEGAAPGLYYVSYGAKWDSKLKKTVEDLRLVFVAKGNLEFKNSDQSWHFAECQYQTTNEYIDKMSWGSNGYNGYYPPDGDNNSARYSSSDSELYTWGPSNAIDNGGNTTGLWVTPTERMLSTLFATRDTHIPLSAIITIDGQYTGRIVLPDDWCYPESLLDCVDETGFKVSSITLEQWELMESYGATLWYGSNTSFEYGPRENSSWQGSSGGIGYWAYDITYCYGGNSTGARAYYFPYVYIVGNSPRQYVTNCQYKFYVRLIQPLE